MKRVYFSDGHIGLQPDGRWATVPGFLEAEQPDEVVFVGDTFHKNECTLRKVVNTRDFYTYRWVVEHFLTEVIKGNHDFDLEEWAMVVTPAEIVESFTDEYGIQVSHWSEVDPACQYLPHWWHKMWAKLFGRQTPYSILQPHDGNPLYLAACGVIHSRMMQTGPGVKIGGHTHLPGRMIFPEMMVDMWNCGDLVDSFTAIVVVDGKPQIKPLPRPV